MPDRYRHHAVWHVFASVAIWACCAAHAAGPFDGKYVGQRTTIRGTPPVCTEGKVTVNVVDSRFSYKYGVATVETQIASDGSFDKSERYYGSNWVTVRGKIDGKILDARVEGISCDFHLSLARS